LLKLLFPACRLPFRLFSEVLIANRSRTFYQTVTIPTKFGLLIQGASGGFYRHFAQLDQIIAAYRFIPF
jgi:hypothetical protein